MKGYYGNNISTCANGAGSSILMKMAVEKVTKALDMNVTRIHHCSIAEGKNTAKEYDIVFCPLNFLPMFREAGLSIAMENAHAEVKAAAQAITASNDKDGVAQAIHKYIL